MDYDMCNVRNAQGMVTRGDMQDIDVLCC